MSANELSNPHKKQKTEDDETQPLTFLSTGNEEIETLMKKANAIRNVNIEIHERLFPPSLVIDTMEIKSGKLKIWWMLTGTQTDVQGCSISNNDISIHESNDRRMYGGANLSNLIGALQKPEWLQQLISRLETDQVSLGEMERDAIEKQQEVTKLSELLGINLREKYPTKIDLGESELKVGSSSTKLILYAIKHCVGTKEVLKKYEKATFYEAIFSQNVDDNFTEKDMVQLFDCVNWNESSRCVKGFFGDKSYTITKTGNGEWDLVCVKALEIHAITDD